MNSDTDNKPQENPEPNYIPNHISGKPLANQERPVTPRDNKNDKLDFNDKKDEVNQPHDAYKIPKETVRPEPPIIIQT